MRIVIWLCLLGCLAVAKACEEGCPDNEEYSDCGANACQNTCENPNLALVCTAAPAAGCICVEGYLRNAKGVCIPACDCPAPTKPPTKKTTQKPKKCEDYPKPPKTTAAPTKKTTPKPTKKITPKPDTCEDDDPKPTKKTTVAPTKKTTPKPTKKTTPKPDTCEDDDPKPTKKTTVAPTKKTTTKPTKKTTPKPTKPKCGKNEVWDKCGNTGCVNTCAEPDLITRCTPAGCNPGCICIDGYLRNSKKQCVAPEECPSCPGPNEFFSCGSACDTTCATLGEECPIINIKCTEMCYCKDGFARNDDGVCIPIDECPPRVCPTDPNAIVTACGNPCPTTCENRFETGPRPCIALCIVNGCVCKEGYIKDEYKRGVNEGKCIKASQCPAPVTPKPTKKTTTCATKKTTKAPSKKTTTRPKTKVPTPPAPELVCGKNEVLVDIPNCPDPTCETYFQDIRAPCLPPDANDSWTPECRCADGFLRNNGKCIKPEQCCSDPNSELVPCPIPCPGGTCQEPKFQPCKRKCDPFGCQCKKGFVKKSDTDATCVKLSQCGKDCGITNFSKSFSYSYSYSYSFSSSSSCETVKKPATKKPVTCKPKTIKPTPVICDLL